MVITIFGALGSKILDEVTSVMLGIANAPTNNGRMAAAETELLLPEIFTGEGLLAVGTTRAGIFSPSCLGVTGGQRIQASALVDPAFLQYYGHGPGRDWLVPTQRSAIADRVSWSKTMILVSKRHYA